MPSRRSKPDTKSGIKSDAKSAVQETPHPLPAAEAKPEEDENTREEVREDDSGEEGGGETVRRSRKRLRRPVLHDTISAVPVAAFHRLVREISQECNAEIRWEPEALRALQVDAEAYLIGRFAKAKETLDLFGRKTVGCVAMRA